MNTIMSNLFGLFLLVILQCFLPIESVRAADAVLDIRVASKTSLVHLGSIDSFDITEGGVKAAKELYQALETGNPESALRAIAAYDQLIPNENFGGEYTALKWFCEYLLASPDQRASMTESPFNKAFFDFFADQDYSILKEYLNRKYHLKELGDEKTASAFRRIGFLEDFILFNNPQREMWEKSSKMLEVLNIKPGEAIADIGSGPGYYTFKFSDLTGPFGRVYAVETNPYHKFFLRHYAKEHRIGNVEVVRAGYDNIGVEKNSIHLAFSCSLYHIIYTTYLENDKDNFVKSIRDSLKDDGRLVIVDNTPLDDETLPYHGPNIKSDLIVAQMWHYGFRLVTTHQFIPQRYMLVFEKRKSDSPASVLGSGGTLQRAAKGSPPLDVDRFNISIATKESLAYVPNSAAPDTSEEGRRAALLFYEALQTRNTEKFRSARHLFGKLIPRERFGDEYTAFAWFCDYFLATSAQKRRMLKDRMVASYFDVLAKNNFEVLKTYLEFHYNFEKNEDGTVVLSQKESKMDQALEEGAAMPIEESRADVKVTSALALAFLDRNELATALAADIDEEHFIFRRDFILFNNPRRESWEKSSLIVKALNLKRGQTVADIGSGPGYYTFLFSKLVGSKGRVYAVDTNKLHLDYIDSLKKEMNSRNVLNVLSELDDVKLPENSIDHAFLCSVYSPVYSTSMEKVKDGFIASLRKALKPKGRLIVVDNAIVKEPHLPYHGPRIDKRLVIAQLAYYGFQLVEEHQFIPQRYVLIFEKARK